MFDLTLSFDNGPDPGVTPFVLDTLRERGVRATFFVVGDRAEGRMEFCRRAHADGHWIGNHTWTHKLPLGERTEPGAAEDEVGRTQRLLGALAHPHRWFRPFGGGGHLDRRLLSPEVAEYLRAERYSCVLWNAVPRDWADPDGWVDTALAQCRNQAGAPTPGALPGMRPWTLMVLHDLPTGAMRHLPRFLDLAAAAGARFRQDFPPACVPVLDGRVVGALDPFVAAPA